MPTTRCPIRERNPWDPVVWVNPCPAPLRVAMRSPLPFPCVPDRPYKISCSCRWGPCPSPTPCLFGVSVLFIYYSKSFCCVVHALRAGRGLPLGCRPSPERRCLLYLCMHSKYAPRTPSATSANFVPQSSHPTLGFSTVLPSAIPPWGVFILSFFLSTVYTRRDARPLPPKATDDSGELHTISRGALPQTTNPQDLI